MTPSPDFRELEEALKKNVRGEVSFTAGSRALYTADASNYRQIPIGVVVPLDLHDVTETLRLCHLHGAPVLTRGAGTSLAGQCCNVAVVIDFSRHLNKILEIDPAKKIARVEPGVILDQLRKETKKYGLTFGPDPATHNRCTIGGMIGNNSCGVHSVMSGKTVDNIESLDVVTYDGLRLKAGQISEAELANLSQGEGREVGIYRDLKILRDQYAELIRTRFPKLPRRVSGYNLDQLLPENGFHTGRALVGTEGTCVTVLEASLQLIEDPPARTLLLLGYPDIYQAADDMCEILSFKPIGLEGLDENFILNMKKSGLHQEEIALFPEGRGWLLVEFGAASQKEADDTAEKLMIRLRKQHPRVTMRLFNHEAGQKKIWSVRESSFGATVFVPGIKDTFAGFEDSAVPPEKLGSYLRELQKLFDKYNYYAVIYGHFGDGCVHSRISFDLRTESGIAQYMEFQEEAADLVIRCGGSLSGEHGDGQTWGRLLHKMVGPELVEAFGKFKKIWDPGNKMNPGKVVDSYGADENLKMKAYATIPERPLNFSFKKEDNNFSRTTERCIGIGKCLKTESGTMCPSYMATREEEHSTRGRAHLLHEMMRGEVLKGGWKEEAVKKSLDLCLACKACQSECPVKVDMATYKAEFLSHYYEGRPRPLAAYGFGLISFWAELASKAPQIVNWAAQNPSLGTWIKKAAGMAEERTIPLFARETFRAWFQKRGMRNIHKPEVLLWPDTFNNYFYPNVARSAVEVLEFLGYRVRIPERRLCCGRPLYDFGMLGTAKKFLKNILLDLRPFISRQIPLIGLEPSCLGVFRDELVNLFPEDREAQGLSRLSLSLGEFLIKNDLASKLPKKEMKALVHGHCHQKALWGMDSEQKIFSQLGMDFTMPDAGCCGMAGAFGFEKEHYEISRKIGERVLLPAVRNASEETLILTDGFSCREQVKQLAGRKPLHLAEFLHATILQSP